MTIKQIYEQIDAERAYAYEKWGDEFDSKNTLNDWASYIIIYLGKAVAMPFDKENTRKQLIKVAGLVINAIDKLDAMPKRHYD
jgi:hypothetical protein